MPPTRGSKHAGPSRIPITVPQSKSKASGRSTRLTALLPTEPEGPSTPCRRSTRHNAGAPSPQYLEVRSSASFSESDEDDDDQDDTPQPRHSHKPSSSLSGAKVDVRRVYRTKTRMRPSLMGPLVEEMTIARRAEMLADVAGDTLIKLLKAGFGSSPTKKDEEICRKAWEALQTVRRTYVFPDHSPPFPDRTELFKSINPRAMMKRNLSALHRAIGLSDLATFVWVILKPNDAGDLLFDTDLYVDDEDEGFNMRTRGNEKGKWKADGDGDAEAKVKIRRRNEMIHIAWMKFWMVVVPWEKRGSESALRLWLDFSTQIRLRFQSPSPQPPTPENTKRLPTHAELSDQNLFSASAVVRFGQWELAEEEDSGAEGRNEEIWTIEKRWKAFVVERESQIKRATSAMKKFPYTSFRQEMMAFIRHEVLGSNELSTLSRSALDQIPIDRGNVPGSYTGSATPSDNDNENDGAMQDIVATAFEDPDDIAEMDAAESSLDQNSDADHPSSDEEVPGDVPLDMDILAEIAMELDRESASPKKRRRTLSPRRSAAPMHESDADDEWALRDHIPVSNVARRVIRKATKSTAPSFDWTAKQADAIRVSWESQSPAVKRAASPSLVSGIDGIATPRPHQRLDTPRKATPTSPSRLPNVATTPRSILRRSLTPPASIALAPLGSAAELIPLRSGSEITSQDIEVVVDRIVDQEDPSGEDEDENDFPDLLPDTQQLQGHILSTEEPLTPQDADFAELLPDTFQLEQESGDKTQSSVLEIYEAEEEQDIDADENVITVEAAPEAMSAALDPPGNLMEPVEDRSPIAEDLNDGEPPEMPIELATQRGVSTSTTQPLVSTNTRKLPRDDGFASPDPNSDAEDRELLHSALRADSLIRPVPPTESIKRSPSPGVLRPPREPIRRPRSRFTADGIDPYVVDSDGSPLEPDPDYSMPRDHVFPRSRIHGQVAGQATSYSRISGKRKWTKAEEILLYRTVQKVPLVEEYPLRVAWYLHGEYGTLSHDLEQFNPQHMKDKMRVIVQARVNNERPVLGRARFFLRVSHPDKEEYEEEAEAFWTEERGKRDAEVAAANAAAERDREAKKRDAAKKAAERDAEPDSNRDGEGEEELDQLANDEDSPANRTKKRKAKRGLKARALAKAKTGSKTAGPAKRSQGEANEMTTSR